MLRKKKRPTMTCDRCGIYGFRTELMGQVHVRTLQGGACGGFWRTMSDNEVAACPACETTGLSANGRCGPCDGRGWRR